MLIRPVPKGVIPGYCVTIALRRHAGLTCCIIYCKTIDYGSYFRSCVGENVTLGHFQHEARRARMKIAGYNGLKFYNLEAQDNFDLTGTIGTMRAFDKAPAALVGEAASLYIAKIACRVWGLHPQ